MTDRRLPANLIGVCGCPSDALCPLCLDGRFSQLRGVAGCRGEAWADDVARVITRDLPWPEGSEKMLTIARRKVEDLARDPVLLEMLAAELVRWAAKRWGGARLSTASASSRG